MGTVPADLRLVESFLNSVDVESSQDDLESLPRFRRWLAAHGRESAARRAGEEDLVLARRLRDVLRDEVRRHHPGVEPPTGHRRRLNSLTGEIGLKAAFTDEGDAVLVPAGAGVDAVLGEVLAAVVTTSTAGTWDRLRICSADDCQYVYYDASKNASKRWCSMEVCGNRAKTRAYRRRRSG